MDIARVFKDDMELAVTDVLKQNLKICETILDHTIYELQKKKCRISYSCTFFVFVGRSTVAAVYGRHGGRPHF